MQDYRVNQFSRDYLVGFKDGAQAVVNMIYRECFGGKGNLSNPNLLPSDLSGRIKLLIRRISNSKEDGNE